jgi:outer membrane lipoprotein SlyB
LRLRRHGFARRPHYGDTAGTVAAQSDRQDTIAAVEIIKADDDYKLGVGTVVGAVAGGLLGSQIGSGRGTAAGAAAGTVAESKLKEKDAQRVTVQMRTGGQVTVMEPVDGRLKSGINVLVEDPLCFMVPLIGAGRSVLLRHRPDAEHTAAPSCSFMTSVNSYWAWGFVHQGGNHAAITPLCEARGCD